MHKSLQIICVQGRTGPAVHRARTGAPLPKIGILRPYNPYIAPYILPLKYFPKFLNFDS